MVAPETTTNESSIVVLVAPFNPIDEPLKLSPLPKVSLCVVTIFTIFPSSSIPTYSFTVVKTLAFSR